MVSFEDLGEGRNHVDLLIDCNLGEENSVGLPVQTLFGYPYSVLAPEFETLHSKKRELNGSIESVLITLGGTDPHSLTSLLADKLLQIQPNLSMTLLAGAIVMNVKYKGNYLVYVIISIILSVIIFYLNDFSRALGETEQISLIMSVWTPLSIVLIISSIGMIHVNEK